MCNLWVKHLLLLCLWIYAATGFAQVNESDTVALQTKISVSGNYQQGNVNILTLRSRLDFSAALGQKWVFKSQNVSLYQAFGKVKADNDVFSRNFLYFDPHGRVYPFAIAFVSANYRRKINLRYFAGLGGTLQLINQPRHVLKVSAGAVYEATQFSASTYNFPEYNGKQTIKAWRATTWMYGRHDLWRRKLRFYYDFYWQPALDNAHNYRWQTDGGLEFPLWKGLSFNALYTYTHENVVVSRIKKDDQLLTFGVSYSARIQ